MMDMDGHVKLVDFGLSKQGITNPVSGASSYCGTPEYLAPEVMQEQASRSYGTAIDWWSLGALLYEMLTGLPPWYNRDRKKMFAGIRGGDLKFPEHVPMGKCEKREFFFVFFFPFSNIYIFFRKLLEMSVNLIFF